MKRIGIIAQKIVAILYYIIPTNGQSTSKYPLAAFAFTAIDAFFFSSLSPLFGSTIYEGDAFHSIIHSHFLLLLDGMIHSPQSGLKWHSLHLHLTLKFISLVDVINKNGIQKIVRYLILMSV